MHTVNNSQQNQHRLVPRLIPEVWNRTKSTVLISCTPLVNLLHFCLLIRLF